MNTDGPYQLTKHRPCGLRDEVRCTQYNVLKFLRESPSDITTIRFQLDAECVYSPSVVRRVLSALEKRGLVRNNNNIWIAEQEND